MRKDEVSKISDASGYSLAALAIIAFGCSNVQSQGQLRMPSERIYTNSIGMKLVRIEPGSFTMGFGDKPLPRELITRKSHFPNGDFDEHPRHKVEITKPF
ncbi:MAG: hypothetical protein ACYSUV_08520, partial [Planctomycetota bacterium]